MRQLKLKGIKRDHIKKLYEAGWTDQQVAEFFGISYATLIRYKAQRKSLRDDIMRWKDVADAKAERSLFESACGYSCPEEKIFIHKKHVTETKPDGTVLEYDKCEVIKVPTVKHYPPQPTSLIFWLTNRLPGDWKRTRQAESSDPLTVKVLNLIQHHNAQDRSPKVRKKMGQSGDNGGNGKSHVTIESTAHIERGGLKVVE